MARYRHPPIWQTALDLAVRLEQAVRRFPRYHKYTLGRNRARPPSGGASASRAGTGPGRTDAARGGTEDLADPCPAPGPAPGTRGCAWSSTSRKRPARVSPCGRPGSRHPSPAWPASTAISPNAIRNARILLQAGTHWLLQDPAAPTARPRPGLGPCREVTPRQLPALRQRLKRQGITHVRVDQTGHLKSGFRRRTAVLIWRPAPSAAPLTD